MALLNAAFKYYRAPTPKYQQVVKKHGILLSKKWDLAKIPYYDDKLMAHVRRNIPDFVGFKTNYLTYLVTGWNPIYGEEDWSSTTIVIVEEELYQRDRLLQIFDASPQGSYGYYAGRGLRPVKYVVQSFAAAKIDEFFASCAPFLAQPMGEAVDYIMSNLETRYWKSRTDFIDWAAGQLIEQRDRSNVVSLSAKLTTMWEGERRPELADGRELTQKQLDQAAGLLQQLAPQIDSGALDGLISDLGRMYDEWVAKNQKDQESRS